MRGGVRDESGGGRKVSVEVRGVRGGVRGESADVRGVRGDVRGVVEARRGVVAGMLFGMAVFVIVRGIGTGARGLRRFSAAQWPGRESGGFLP